MKVALIVSNVVVLAVCSKHVNGQDNATAPYSFVTVIDPNGNEAIGSTQSGVDSFLGIQYATVGTRFGQSEPHLESFGNASVVNATAYGPTCYQPTFLPGGPPPDHSEECLYLNIWRPGADDLGRVAKDLPVMVWIHGGGFVVGSGSDRVYDGSALARGENVIVVTINYRLGVFGMLVTDETGAGGMNWLHDQINALEWVRSHIASFGGDPDKVTIFGESAGSISVCYLSVSPVADGLFRRAILESGPCIYSFLQPLTAAEGFAGSQFFLNVIGASSADELAAYTGEQLNQITAMNFTSPGTMEGYVMPRLPIELFKEGAVNAQEMIIGATSYDDALFLSSPIPEYMALAAQFDANIHGFFDEEYGVAASDRVIEAYSPKDVFNGSNVSAFAQFQGDFLFKCQGRELAAITAASGIPSYVYDFAHYSDNDLSNLVGLRSAANIKDPSWASHTAEIPFVFGNIDYTFAGPAPFPNSAAEEGLSLELMFRWAEFARTGNPNTEAEEGEGGGNYTEWLPVPSDLPLPATLEEASDVSELRLQSIGGIGSYMTSKKTAQCSAIPGIPQLRFVATDATQAPAPVPALSSPTTAVPVPAPVVPSPSSDAPTTAAPVPAEPVTPTEQTRTFSSSASLRPQSVFGVSAAFFVVSLF